MWQVRCPLQRCLLCWFCGLVFLWGALDTSKYGHFSCLDVGDFCLVFLVNSLIHRTSVKTGLETPRVLEYGDSWIIDISSENLTLV